MLFFFFSSRRRHTRFDCDWSSDVCSSDLTSRASCLLIDRERRRHRDAALVRQRVGVRPESHVEAEAAETHPDRKSTRLNSSHSQISYAVFCLKKKIMTA